VQALNLGLKPRNQLYPASDLFVNLLPHEFKLCFVRPFPKGPGLLVCSVHSNDIEETLLRVGALERSWSGEPISEQKQHALMMLEMSDQ